MKNVIITGSSGMIGGLVLRECLERADVARVTTVVRRPSRTKHAKLNEVVHDDLLDLSTVSEQLKEQDICFFCVGVYTGAVPSDVFRRITVDCTAAFARALKQQSPHVVFCLLSGDGADRTEKSRMMFARDKGTAENILVGLGFDRFHTFRPGYIYPVEPRTEPNGMYRMMRVLWKPLLSKLGPNVGVASTQLAHAMVEVAFGGGKEILENRDIRMIGAR
jgi:uncharacterized protein YbjT (DUF2867 family)